ncbi:hypothetical protein [Pseudodesulfovibrio piezophilus]|uniref:hypothetical protein n=1 Tax=Pseudodesulfovibrio piezophilus TaxID=879567 RepID=UPI0003475901|nr:hypothetical protein [Pseudodesulfovibrio piezophilus]
MIDKNIMKLGSPLSVPAQRVPSENPLAPLEIMDGEIGASIDRIVSDNATPSVRIEIRENQQSP